VSAQNATPGKRTAAPSGLLNPPGRICGCEWCDNAAAYSQPGDLERIIRRTYPAWRPGTYTHPALDTTNP